jgi:hypothetical protein
LYSLQLQVCARLDTLVQQMQSAAQRMATERDFWGEVAEPRKSAHAEQQREAAQAQLARLRILQGRLVDSTRPLPSLECHLDPEWKR